MGAMFLRMLVVFSLFFGVFFSQAQAHSVEHIQRITKGRVSAEDAERIVAAVHRSSQEQNLNPAWIFKIIQAESTFNPKARSHMNARGLMQIIVKWHPKEVSKRDIHDIDVNIDAGTRIVRKYLDQCSGNMRCAMRKYNGSRGDRYYAKVNNMRMFGDPAPEMNYALRHLLPPSTREEKLTFIALLVQDSASDSL